MMKTKLLLISAAAAALLTLSGCSTIAKFTGVAAGVNDEALNAAEFTICQAASVGSIRRHYGDADKAKVWAELCNSTDTFTPESK